jgi:hypothetical protein
MEHPPFFKRAWTNKTVFISIGSSKSALADLEIAEKIGCPLIIVPGSEESLTGWIEVAECIKTHQPVLSPKSDFSKGSDDKWIPPKNLRIEAAKMPFWKHATIFKVSDTYSLECVPFYDWVESQCKVIGLSPEETRIDILKIGMQEGNERSILYAALDAGFRPSALLINWSALPDTDVPTKMAMGHLQNCGYSFVRKKGIYSLYYFNSV